MCEQLGETRPCRTADEVLPGSEDGANYVARRAAGGRSEDDLADDQLVCECELMPRAALVEAAAAPARA